MAVIVLLAAGAALLAWAWRAGSGGHAQLPDGTQLTLNGVTHGRQHRHVAGGLMGLVREALARVPLLDRIGIRPPPRFGFHTTNDVVTCWFRLRSPQPHTRPTHQARVLEASAREAARATSYRAFSVTTNETVWAITFANYPRAARTLPVELHSWLFAAETNWTVTHTFRVRNPRRTRAVAAPAPESLTATADRLTVGLEQLTGGLPNTNSAGRLLPAAASLARAQFTLHELGHPTTNWQPLHVTGWHPDGNYFHRIGTPRVMGTGRVELLFEEALWTSRVPWRLRCAFARAADFAPADLWTNHLVNISQLLAADPAAAPLAVTTNQHGRVMLMKVTPGSRPESGLNLHVRLESARDDVEVSVARVTTETGRVLASRVGASTRGSGFKGCVFELEPGIVQSLEVILAVHAQRQVEFQAVPKP